jgi:hypothetical protein
MEETPGFVATIDGASAVEAFPPTAEAPVAVIAPTEPMVPVAPRPRAAARRGRPGGRVMSRVLMAAIAAAFALYAAGVGGDLLGMIRSGASARTVPAEGGSLLRAVALTAALHGLPQGRVEALRVAADRIDARVVVDGRVRLVRVTARGWVTDVPAPERPTGTRVRVDPRAPARFVRTVTRRTPASVAHLRLEGARWQLVLEDGRQFSADVHGRAVRIG